MTVLGEIQERDLNLWSVSHALAPGHRLASEVPSGNLGTGESCSQGTGPVVTTQTLFHDTDPASSITVTIHP